MWQLSSDKKLKTIPDNFFKNAQNSIAARKKWVKPSYIDLQGFFASINPIGIGAQCSLLSIKKLLFNVFNYFHFQLIFNSS